MNKKTLRRKKKGSSLRGAQTSQSLSGARERCRWIQGVIDTRAGVGTRDIGQESFYFRCVSSTLALRLLFTTVWSRLYAQRAFISFYFIFKSLLIAAHSLVFLIIRYIKSTKRAVEKRRGNNCYCNSSRHNKNAKAASRADVNLSW